MTRYLIKGKLYNPILVGDDGDFYEGTTRSCTDCGAKQGEQHKEDCDCERCPCCGKQLISCECGPIYEVEEDATQEKINHLIEIQRRQLKEKDAEMEME